MSQGEREGEEKHDSGQPEGPKQRRHDHFRQPFVRCPFERRVMKRIGIVSRDLPGPQNDFSRADMVAGIAVA